MAAFILIEFNGDHIAGCKPEELGYAVQTICRNLSNEQYVIENATPVIGRTVRAIGVSGKPTYASDIKKTWLGLGRWGRI